MLTGDTIAAAGKNLQGNGAEVWTRNNHLFGAVLTDRGVKGDQYPG
ncbi:MAG: hypothetical protein J2P21_18795 [Chloracidobacterium sp.]|nr:hypothetical protein [Chloracidobacterium sp.]